MSDQKVIVGEVVTCLKLLESIHMKKFKDFPYSTEVQGIKKQLEAEFPEIFERLQKRSEYVSQNLSDIFIDTIQKIHQWEKNNHCETILQLIVYENTGQLALCGKNVEK